MEGPHEMESEQIESVMTNTDDILSSVPVSRSAEYFQVFPRNYREIRKLKTTINSLRSKINGISNICLYKFRMRFDVQELLNKDPKHAIDNNNARHLPINHIIANSESNITKLSSENQNEIRLKMANTLQSHYNKVKNSRLNPTQQKMLNDFKRTKKFINDNPQIIITKPDKGNSTVVMNESSYTSKMEELLSDATTYKSIKKDITNTLTARNNTFIKDWEKRGFISPQIAKSLLIHNSIPPNIYGLPKIHKTNIPLRPIISHTQSPLYKLSKHLSSVLFNVVNKNVYHTKNSFDLKASLDGLHIPTHHGLFSLDIVPLYTNIPTELVPIIIEKKWPLIEPHTCIPKDEFIKAVKLTLETCHFQYKNVFYLQIYGVAMGSPIASTIAQLVLEYLEEEILANSNYDITIFKRYVDDCLIITSEQQVQEILAHLSGFHNKIQFTIEKEKNNSINFLDITIIRNNNKLETKLYRKPTNTDWILDYNSAHSERQKRAIITNYIDRAIKVASPRYRPTILEETITLLTKNNYPINKIKRILKHRTHKLYNTLDTTTKKEPTTYIPIPNIPQLSEKIENILRPYSSIKIAHRPHLQIKQV
ncbi:uncharacterized protein LOC123315905 [Coccinella septempunctata]|uniref:uncharacterized protein LOC123315905 n=1 Tax=Coccinella septempunctata TaxID=41139 RepID=UPI001D05D5E4|nr:uncharacterized protein LOC123315905 [Coccinella septempunctata]